MLIVYSTSRTDRITWKMGIVNIYRNCATWYITNWLHMRLIETDVCHHNVGNEYEGKKWLIFETAMHSRTVVSYSSQKMTAKCLHFWTTRLLKHCLLSIFGPFQKYSCNRKRWLKYTLHICLYTAPWWTVRLLVHLDNITSKVYHFWQIVCLVELFHCVSLGILWFTKVWQLTF